MNLSKKQVDIVVDEIKQERQQYAIDGTGNKGTDLIEYLLSISYANHVKQGVSRHIHKRLLEFMELSEYWKVCREIATEIEEYNNIK